MTVRGRGKDCEAIFAALPVRSAAPVRLRGAAGQSRPRAFYGEARGFILFPNGVQRFAASDLLRRDGRRPRRHAEIPHIFRRRGEKTGGSATVTINGIQITGAYTDSDDGCDTYKAAGAQFTLTADGGITRFSASGDEYNARTETVSTEEALQLCPGIFWPSTVRLQQTLRKTSRPGRSTIRRTGMTNIGFRSIGREAA